MSTKILCDESSCNRRANGLTLDANELHAKPGELFLHLNGDRSLPGHYVVRADFLAAVEHECVVRIVPTDAIVIDRADLPVVTASISNGVDSRDIPDDAREQAMVLLALAEYRDAHPPIDVVQVKALETALRELCPLPLSALARRLVARGVRVDLP